MGNKWVRKNIAYNKWQKASVMVENNSTYEYALCSGGTESASTGENA